MISLTPNGTPEETAGAYALLQVISDPKLAKSHLDMLSAKAQDAAAAQQAAGDQLAEARATQSDAAAKLAEAQRISDDFNATHETRAKQLAQFSDDLGTRQDRLNEFEAALTARETGMDRDLTSREEAVKAREIAVTERETIAKKTGDEAQLLKETYERKVSALQAALSPGAAA